MPDQDLLWQHLRDLPFFRSLLRSVEARFFQDFNLAAPTLDIGCGDGHFASVTFSSPLEAGVDSLHRSLQEAIRRNCYRILIQADAARMPFPDDYFASAISNSVLEHIPQVELVLSEIERVIKPGGILLFTVPNPGYLSELSIATGLKRLGTKRLACAYADWFKRMSSVYHLDYPDIWRLRLENAGFKLNKYWHYFSPGAMRLLEWGHYLGIPSLFMYKITKRWIIAPTRWNLALPMWLARSFAVANPHPRGTFTFFVASKSPNTDSLDRQPRSESHGFDGT